jgi:hypothetical protein
MISAPLTMLTPADRTSAVNPEQAHRGLMNGFEPFGQRMPSSSSIEDVRSSPRLSLGGTCVLFRRCMIGAKSRIVVKGTARD